MLLRPGGKSGVAAGGDPPAAVRPPVRLQMVLQTQQGHPLAARLLPRRNRQAPGLWALPMLLSAASADAVWIQLGITGTVMHDLCSPHPPPR